MPRPTPPPPHRPDEGGNIAEFTVSELAMRIKRTVEGVFGHVRLRGEVLGYRGPHASGHCYFSLKDEKAKIDAVIWRGVFSRLKFRPEEGLEVIATGRITTYPGSSKYQIAIEHLEPAGVGALMALLEERKRKLKAEGLFDEDRKRPLPFLPRLIGIVTSPTGAVIRDMLHGFTERFPTRVIVWPVRVQGESCASEVAAAVRGFNALPAPIPRPDLIIVARGGGSLEDLWGFNEEIVVRAVAESAIPVIAAVGHETDWTLIDLAADARAPTPTKAAEWAVPKHSDLIQRMGELEGRLRLAMRRRLEGLRYQLRGAARALPRPMDLVQLPRQHFDAVAARLGRALLANTQTHAARLARISGRLAPRLLAGRLERGRERLTGLGRRSDLAARHVLEARRRRLDGLAGLLATLSHRRVLERGFALVRDGEGRMLRRVARIASGDRLTIEFADGAVDAEAFGGQKARRAERPTGTTKKGGSSEAGAHKPRSASGKRPPAKQAGSAKKRNDPSSQGSLF